MALPAAAEGLKVGRTAFDMSFISCYLAMESLSGLMDLKYFGRGACASRMFLVF
jgi:hypothetical protein